MRCSGDQAHLFSRESEFPVGEIWSCVRSRDHRTQVMRRKRARQWRGDLFVRIADDNVAIDIATKG
ncbi:hypothetical protein C5B95_07440 [Rathayibacter sp. AY1A7]|nr:hypothetical protein C5B95_07440 [Rathayibacter sp. AY1A7]